MIRVFILIKECVWSSRLKLPQCQAHSHSLAYAEEDYVKALDKVFQEAKHYVTWITQN